MDSPSIAPFLLARDAYRRYVQLREACLRMAEERLRRSKLRTTLMRLLTAQALADARLQADGAACALASAHGEGVFASAGIRTPVDCFFGGEPLPREIERWPEDAEPRQRDWASGDPPVDRLAWGANYFLQSIRSLPVLSNTRAVDAREKRLETDYTKAMACLQEHSLDHQAAYVNAVHFRQALPEAVGARVLELAY